MGDSLIESELRQLRVQLRQTQKNENNRLRDLQEELKSKEQTIARLSRENQQALEAQEAAQRAESELRQKLQEAEANALAAQAAEFETEMEALRTQLEEHLHRQQQRQQTDSKINREELQSLQAQLHLQSAELQSLRSQLQQQERAPFDPELYKLVPLQQIVQFETDLRRGEQRELALKTQLAEAQRGANGPSECWQCREARATLEMPRVTPHCSSRQQRWRTQLVPLKELRSHWEGSGLRWGNHQLDEKLREVSVHMRHAEQLEDSLEVQQYRSELNEMRGWLIQRRR